MAALPETPPPGRGGAELPYTQKGLAEAGEQPDRNLLTRAGRALQKHLARETGRAEEWRSFISERLNDPLPTTASEYR